MSLTFHSALRKLNTDAFNQISVDLSKQFQRRRFLEIDQPETRIGHVSHVCKRIGTNLLIFIEYIQYMFPTTFRFIWQSDFRVVVQWVRSLDLTVHTSISPIRRGFAPSFLNYKLEAPRSLLSLTWFSIWHLKLKQKMGVLNIILIVGHLKIISTQISEQKILIWFVSLNIPKWNKLAEKIPQKTPEYVKLLIAMQLQLKFEFILICNKAENDNKRNFYF